MALSIGEIEAVLKARDELTGVLKLAQKEIGKLGTEGEATSTRLSSAFSGLGTKLAAVFTVTAVVGFTRELVRMGDEITRIADRTGMTTDEVQQFKFAAEQSGNTIEELTGSIGQMQNRLASGDDSALGALSSLGLSFEVIRGMAPAEQFRAIAAAIGEVQDPATQAQLAMDLFGRSGIAILPTIKSNFDEIADSAPKMSAATVRALDEAGDTWDRLVLTLKVAAAESLNTATSFDSLGVIFGQTSLQARATGEALRDLAEWFSYFASRGELDLPDPSKIKPPPPSVARGLEAIRIEGADLDDVYRTLDNTLKDNNQTWKEQERAAKEAKEEFQRLKDALYAIERQVTASDYFHTLSTDIDKVGLKTDLVTDKFLEMSLAFDEMNRKANVALNYFGVLPGYMDQLGTSLPIPQMNDLAEAFGITTEQLQAFVDANDGVDDLSEKFSGLADIFHGINSTWGQLTAVVLRGIALMTKEGTTMGQKLFAAFSTAAEVVGQLAGASLLAQAAMGGLQGASIGAALAVAMQWGGAAASMSAGIGAAVGFAIGLFVAMKQEADRAAAAAAEADAQLHELRESLDDLYGSLANAERIAAVFGRTLSVYGESQQIVERLTRAIEELQQAQEEAFESLETNSGLATRQLLDLLAAMEDTYEHTVEYADAQRVVGREFTRMGERAESFGRVVRDAIVPGTRAITEMSEAADEFIQTQLTSAGSGLGALLEGLQASSTAILTAPIDAEIERAELLRQRLEDIDTAGMSQAAVDDIQAQIDVLDVFITRTEAYRDSLVGTFIQTERQAQGLGAAIVGTFAEMIARGNSFSDALEAVQPAITTLQAQLVATGFDGGAAFAGLAYMAEQAADPIVGPLFDAVAGVNQALQGLHNSGILNQEMFSGLAMTAVDAFNQMIADGVNADAAMMVMQPTLQTLWQLSEDFNYSLSDEEQQLVDNGVAAGMVGNQFRDAADRMARSMDRVVEVLELIATGMGFDVTRAAADAEAASTDAMSETEAATDDASEAVNELTASIGRTIEELNNLDTQPFDDIVAAAGRAAAAVDALNFGHSPGGLKEIPILLDRSAERARAFARVMESVSTSAMDGIDGMTGEMEALIRQLGLMYAFASDFDDFFGNDEKRLKEAGLYEFWRQWREQFFGGGESGSGGGDGGGGTIAPGMFGIPPRVDQTIVINLDGAVIARQVMRDLPRQVQMYTR